MATITPTYPCSGDTANLVIDTTPFATSVGTVTVNGSAPSAEYNIQIGSSSETGIDGTFTYLYKTTLVAGNNTLVINAISRKSGCSIRITGNDGVTQCTNLPYSGTPPSPVTTPVTFTNVNFDVNTLTPILVEIVDDVCA